MMMQIKTKFNFREIPPVLQNIPQWVNWDRNKVPLSPKGGNASSTDPRTWGSFSDAKRRYELSGNGIIAGIGLVITGSNMFCIDLDNCRDPESGEVEESAMEIVRQFNSYTEISPSGTGLHIWCEGTLIGEVSNRRGKGFEVYCKDHYMTMTGNVLENYTTIKNGKDALDEFCLKHFSKDNAESTHQEDSKENDETMSDEEIVERASSASNGDKFKRLFVDGDWSDYPSQSEADHALASLLDFWTQDYEQKERILRKSALNREKWDKNRTYLNRTIESAKAIEHFTPQSESIDIASQTPLNLTFPDETIQGVCRDFANLYSSELESPWQFFAFNFLTLLGAIISDRVKLDTSLGSQPRLYTVLLGESATDRKSESIQQTLQLFDKFSFLENVYVSWGAGSAEGLGNLFTEKKQALLIYDELKSFVCKSNIDGAILLPAVNTLFEANRFHSHTKTHKIEIEEGRLSILGASTIETFSRMFSANFLDIGFINRLFLVTGTSKREKPIPKEIPFHSQKIIADHLYENLNLFPHQTIIKVKPDAEELYKQWYISSRGNEIYTKRLDAYALRLMQLFCVNEGQREVTPSMVKRITKILNWQENVRKVCDPSDAETLMAKAENSLRRALLRGPLSKRELERKCNAQRIGIYYFKRALNNLSEEKMIGYDQQKKVYYATEEV